ncbi:hypothetical protein B6U67_00810 [Methanosarcinales archaeon ex4484_138]|nr:MAG: hypothetical protein B6U67_00810 [Methanosarcinales archaeon ex4484_138]
MASKIKTIRDLYELWYGGSIPGDTQRTLLQSIFMKTDDPITTGSTGIINPQYGAVVDTLLNYEADAWKLLAKKPYDSAGFRLETARPATLVSGVAENGALPDTIEGTFTEEEIVPKWMMTRWEITHNVIVRSELGDGIPQTETFFREKNAEYFEKGMNQALLADAEAAASGASGNTTNAAGNNIESIDRIISSDSEEDAFGGSYTGWYDAYGSWDRDSGTTYDAVVSHNSGTDRGLKLDLIDDLIRQCRDAGAKKENQIFLTDSETFMDWSALIDPKYRITDVGYKVTENGVTTEVGAEEAVARAVVYDGRPIFISEDVPTDGAGRIYLIDTSALYIKVYMPTMYMQTKLNPDVLLVDAIKQYYAYLWVGEVFCTSPTRQGKIRDLA